MNRSKNNNRIALFIGGEGDLVSRLPQPTLPSVQIVSWQDLLRVTLLYSFTAIE
jgi:hypothetical protein